MNQNAVYVLIPILAPVLVACLRRLLPKLPRWLLPSLATAVGPLADYAGTFATGADTNPLLALALGAAGVGLREIADQTKKRVLPLPKP